jgi:hypothetical protein
MNNLIFPESLHALAREHFVLLEPENIKKHRDTLQLRLSGYSDVVHLTADIVKVCILALGSDGNATNAHIPEPETNISAVLSIILDLLPYEEADLLDKIRIGILNPPPPDEQFLLESITLVPPASLGGQPWSA